VKLLVDELLSLELIEKDFERDMEIFSITKVGRQVLKAVQDRGFSAED
jgi:hypothetical protein